MAYFAELDENNVVLRVVAIATADCLDAEGVEHEALGLNRCLELFKTGTWKKTSFNGNIRKNFAGIGFTYDQQRDAFIAPQPEGDGWTLDENSCTWRNPAREAAQQQVQIGVTRV